ncbi:glycosyltransferase family 9 protein [Curvibacter sp. CHRR-16]|uniref:glycosyltransferase family 9 protein n=1 Tax=Curvibacter sp. CHRR-16 TaxID=2835872 RepID=UPI001BDAB81A|nr:glycosyltransferase family 9 protein [Curvibacter sp. CHRR-16]MBT0569467.1 glycosyltransferase family 9 protein [Curvibacter sp. CHRR-16]
MNIQTQRFIDRWAGQLLCAAVSGWVRLSQLWKKPSSMPREPRHILVILLSEMGSIVLAGPMFAQLRRQYPTAAIHILQLKKNQEVSRMLRLTDEAYMHSLNDKSGAQLVLDILRVSWRLRRLGLDAVIDCELFSRVSALLSFTTGAPIRSGFTAHTQEGLYRGSFINRSIPYNPYQHISKQFLSLVDALGSGQSMPRNRAAPLRNTPRETELSVPFTANELSAYSNKLVQDHPTVQGRKLVLLYAGGGILPERAWPAEHYAHLARGLCDAGHAVGLIGLRDDAPLAQSLIAQVQSPLCRDLTGYTKSIRELLMLMHAAALLVTNDGGPSHFATLTPIQTMVFFGPETGLLYGPLGDKCRILESGIACSPCLTAYNHRLTFCDGDNQCLQRIPPEPVLADALTFLSTGTMPFVPPRTVLAPHIPIHPAVAAPQA